MKLLCAGPTSIDKRVMDAMGQFLTNPDLDPEYTKFHRNVEKKISKLLKTEATSFLMLGEAIMGLEGAVCSLMERGERVLVLHNGYFGKGFSDYVERYGGKAVELKFDYRRGIDLKKLNEFLDKDSDFSIATFVHCETPSGITNNIKEIAGALNKRGILTIVDSVSAIGGEEINFDEDKVDILIGGSQKCLSAPVGLTTITISQRAKEKIAKRKTKVSSYYLNFENYYNYTYDSFDFPYTMNENLVYALNMALDILFEKDSINLHKKYAESTRKTIEKAGLKLYPLDSHSNTVTAVLSPEGIDAREITRKMREHGMIISGSIQDIEDKVFRIGHMGNNINKENFIELFQKLDIVFEELGVKLKTSLKDQFKKEINK